jgi:phosphoglycolate phosphatase (TIGR01487 family)
MNWLVTDIDGTITDAEGRLDENALRELQALERSGVSVGLISGRPYPLVRILGEYLGVSGPLIAENGGVGVWRHEEFILGSRRVAEDALRVVQQEMQVAATWDSRFRETDVAIDCPVDVDQMRRIFQKHGTAVDMHVSSIMVHLSKAGVSKRTGLEHACAMAGIDHDSVIVAGDADSDIPMFEGFRNSIAPANCTPGIAALAKFRAAASHGAGFCEGLRRYRG